MSSNDIYISLGGFALTRVALHVPNVGPWFADCDFADDASSLKPQSQQTLKIGGTNLVGTLQRSRDGTFAIRRKARLLAGAGGWGNSIPAKSYHNDRGVSAKTVSTDAATACGESLGSFTSSAKLGPDYARQAGIASRTIDDVVRGDLWWVGYDGVTVVGPRPAHALSPNASVLDVDPRASNVTLAVDEITDVAIGDKITDERIAGSLTVNALEVHADHDTLRVIAWCGSGKTNQLVDALRNVVNRVSDTRGLFGIYRYQVSGMRGDRVDVQPINKLLGLPSMIAIRMNPGVAGAHATLKAGTEVRVQFLDGDRSQPVITGFVGRGESQDVPELLELGGPNGSEVAGKGDSVQVLLPPATFSGTVNGFPAAGAIIWATPQTLGQITTGSSKVRRAP